MGMLAGEIQLDWICSRCRRRSFGPPNGESTRNEDFDHMELDDRADETIHTTLSFAVDDVPFASVDDPSEDSIPDQEMSTDEAIELTFWSGRGNWVPKGGSPNL